MNSFLRIRSTVGAAACAWLALMGMLTPCPAAAQSAFPGKAIKIVVPNAAGGAADITARIVGQKLGEALGQPVVIENKPSAGGVVAGEQVARSEPDGHTLLLISSGTAVSASLFKVLPFDTLKDFSPVSKMAVFDLVIAVSESGRFKTIADLLAYARANPGKLNLGTPQIGTTQNLAAELFASSAGIAVQIIPFNGTPPVINALRGGEIDAMVDILGPLMPQVQAKALRALALMGEQRFSGLPEVPVLRESGGSLAQFHVASWNGLAGPAKTPRDVVSRLNREIQTILKMPDVLKRTSELNVSLQGGTPEQAYELLVADIRRWAEVIERAKIPRQ